VGGTISHSGVGCSAAVEFRQAVQPETA